MAKIIRRPPSVADNQDPRSREYFDQDIYDQMRLAGTVTTSFGPLPAGSQTPMVIPVNGARKDKGQTVEYGLPSAWNANLTILSVYVSNDDEVSIVIKNPTGGTISIASATYGVRVRP